jgi:Ser/Thr protein kinase RdoA (MazF antagonist)
LRTANDEPGRLWHGSGVGTRPPVRGELSPGASRYFDGPDWGWQQLWLTSDHVVEVCRARFGVPAEQAILLAEGMLNQTWRISCPDHDRVLRVGREERTTEQVAYEHAAASAWATVTPQLVVAEHHEAPVVDGHTLTLFPFVEGISGTGVAGPERARQLAPVLAAMHRASLALGLGQRPGFLAVDESPRWFGWSHARARIVERFGRGPDVTGPSAVVDRTIEHLDPLLDRWQATGHLSMRATVHGDLNARNQLYRDGVLVGIIDTDECRLEPLVWDIAVLAHSEPDVSPLTVWRDYLAADGPLDPADGEMLAPFARIAALSELTWLTDDAGIATHLALRNLTDIAHQLAEGGNRGG